MTDQYADLQWNPRRSYAERCDEIEDTPHRNADTRIREAFDALRAEMVSLFGEHRDPFDPDVGEQTLRYYDWAMSDLSYIQDGIHDFAKLPADA